MKELVLKRQTELEEIYKGAHVDFDSDGARRILIDLIDSGIVELKLIVDWKVSPIFQISCYTAPLLYGLEN